MKKLIIATMCLLIVTITSCSSSQNNSQNDAKGSFLQGINTEDLYDIPFELDENQTGLSEEEVVALIKKAYSNSRLIVDVYCNDETRMYDCGLFIDVYDPILEKSLFVPGELGSYDIPEENSEKWIKYLMQYGEQCKIIYKLLKNNNIRDTVDLPAVATINIYLDNIEVVDVDHKGTLYADIMCCGVGGYQILNGVTGEVIDEYQLVSE